MGANMKLDPITTQVIGNLILSIAEEMGATLMKTAYSPNIKERGDRSTAIFDASGQVIAQAQLIPTHLGSMLGAVHEVIKRHPVEKLKAGDMFIANDPYNGGGHHLPDVNLVAPVFFRGALVGYVASIGHHSDVGGMVAGSESGICTEIYQEGLRIPPVRLVQAGEVNEDILNIILLNTRTPKDRLGDLRAQIAANRVGVRGMIQVCERYGPELVAASTDELLNYSERLIRSKIAEIPDGVYEATDFLDNDGVGDSKTKIHLTMTIAGDHIKFDFAGSDPQVRGSRNVPTASLKAVVLTVVKSMVDPALPPNSGYYRAVEISAPSGSVLNPLPPGAVGERSLTNAVVGDVLWQALSQAVPARAMAGSGPHRQIIPSGINPGSGEFFVNYETIAGALGARPYKDGIDAVRIHGSGAANLPVESLELNFPLMVERYELRQDSGGPGQFQGGLGIRRDYRVLADGIYTSVCGEREFRPAGGIQDGMAGGTGRFTLNPGTSAEKVLPSTGADILLPKGTLLRVDTPGGGGCGDPSKRDRALVVRDVAQERISEKIARTVYGLKPEAKK
jgi:N-methylhydantoinase B